jgi:hypothetical protein
MVTMTELDDVRVIKWPQWDTALLFGLLAHALLPLDLCWRGVVRRILHPYLM